MKYSSMELTRELGRWEQLKTAKGYISAAVAEVAKINVSARCQGRAERCRRVLRQFLESL